MSVIFGLLAASFIVLLIYLKTVFSILIICTVFLAVFTGLWDVWRFLTASLPPYIQKLLFAVIFVSSFAFLFFFVWREITVIIGFLSDVTVLKNTVVRLIEEASGNTDSITMAYFMGQVNDKISALFNAGTLYLFSGVSRFVILAGGIVLVCPSLFIIYFRGREKLRGDLVSLIPDRYAAETVRTFSDIVERFRNYLYVRIAECLLTAVVFCIGFYLIGIPQWLLLGLIGGLFMIVPYVGPLIGAFLAMAVGLSGGAGTAVSVLILYVVVVLIDYLYLVRSLDRNIVHPLVVIPMVFIFAHLFGLFGMILCVPVYILCKIILTESHEQLAIVFPEKKDGFSATGDGLSTPDSESLSGNEC